ncbi:hypothetical protein Dimus_033394 [Dionaea muscipula]
MATNTDNDLFFSLITDIRTYTGTDPLLPWLRGVRRLRESLPAKLLKAKLPRFLQKCAQTFDSDPRYRNDIRYIRVWLQLMDFVDEPKVLLRAMETKGIGTKLCLFYQAYALYYEKVKKYEEADKIYRLGAQNLAEPLDKLQKSYEQFLQRIVRRKNKSIQLKEGKTEKRPLSNSSFTHQIISCRESNPNSCDFDGTSRDSGSEEHKVELQFNCHGMGSNKILKECCTNETNCKGDFPNRSSNILSGNWSTKKQVLQHDKTRNDVKSGGRSMLDKDDAVFMKFVDTAILGKPEAENACHHGLVEPTVNTKDAMDAINGMFQEPLEPALVRKSSRKGSESDQSSSSKLEVFTDENTVLLAKTRNEIDDKRIPLPQCSQAKMPKPLHKPLTIFVDYEECDEVKVEMGEKDDMEVSELQPSVEGLPLSSPVVETFVLTRRKDNSSESFSSLNVDKSTKTKFHEDTVVCKFVGAAISDEPEVENICHHGLVEPTVNLKEAMDDINGMFGKPIDFVRPARKKKEKAAPSGKSHPVVFAILHDDEFVCQQVDPLASSSCREGQMLEPTVCMKEAMDEINKMFAMPMDF